MTRSSSSSRRRRRRRKKSSGSRRRSSKSSDKSRSRGAAGAAAAEDVAYRVRRVAVSFCCLRLRFSSVWGESPADLATAAAGSPIVVFWYYDLVDD